MHGTPILNTRISSLCPSFLCHAQGTPPEVWNRLDWIALVKSKRIAFSLFFFLAKKNIFNFFRIFEKKWFFKTNLDFSDYFRCSFFNLFWKFSWNFFSSSDFRFFFWNIFYNFFSLFFWFLWIFFLNFFGF